MEAREIKTSDLVSLHPFVHSKKRIWPLFRAALFAQANKNIIWGELRAAAFRCLIPADAVVVSAAAAPLNTAQQISL